jgi:ribosomal protein S18 acetylase RimI-like enzyme
MDVAIRPATDADAQAISVLNAYVQAIHAAALPQRFKPPGAETFPPESVRALLAAPHTLLFVAHAGSTPAGYVYAEVVLRPETPFTWAYEMVHVHHISVHADFRHRGVGRALLDAVRGAGAARGIETLALDVWTFNEPARDFFRRYGLTPYNERLWLTSDVSGRSS